MSAIARVVVDVARDREFDYLVPAEMRGRVRVGSRVHVPFGRQRKTGYVVALAPASSRGNLKSIAGIVGDKPFIDEIMLRLARWMASYYCAPVENAIRAMLPGAVRRGGAGFRTRRTVRLTGSRHGVRPEGGIKLTVKQERILRLLNEHGSEMGLSDLLVMAETTLSPVRSLERKGLVFMADAALMRNPLANRNILRTRPLTLMPEQEMALEEIDRIVKRLNPPAGAEDRKNEGAGKETGVVLLHGVTGSGKTEVYLQAIGRVSELGKGAIVLVPEISLTPQTVERFVGRFGDRVAVLHSHLSDGERHDEWHRIRDGGADIVIGARSAVFAPLRPGLIVVDEEHEPSYKQEETPRYNARDIAVMRGMMEGCAVVLGSATPSLESWHNAMTGKYRLATLPHRADNRRMPRMRIVDMRIPDGKGGRGGIFSQDLLNAIKMRLERAEQTILFLNRRGYATSLICPKCGYVAKCGNCSVSYTYHREGDVLRCHICGGTKAVPGACPGCGDPSFRFAGVGTQRVEKIVRKCFPHARIQRMDTDIMTGKDSYDRILGEFRAGKTDILIGTQMIAKGLHFPNVTLVGVVYADLSLHMPDFRASERTFQLLAQVAGRAGRGEVYGEVIIQTYTPSNDAVQAASRLDYEGFCAGELKFRQELCYPPFSHLVCVALKGRSEQKTAFHTAALARRLAPLAGSGVRVSDPSPAPLAKARGMYRYQIMLRSRSVSRVAGPLTEALRGFKLPRDVSLAVDVDALSLM